ncbi:MAG: hypothetical protein QXV17_02690 [Candidatus Micrarchaeaceae archaeon]|uniref:hypothetical protein n=1 Tax=Metallosphaera sp. TaxID=2020860 RepID=UPI00315FC422
MSGGTTYAETARHALIDVAYRLDLARLMCPYLEMTPRGRYICKLNNKVIDPELHPCEFTSEPDEKRVLLRLRCVVDRVTLK